MKQKIAVLTIATFLVLSLFFAVSAGAATLPFPLEQQLKRKG